jgi:pyrroline-5-carboxylate reductase
MQQPVIAFIGAGNMASAIISGLIKNDYSANKIIATNRSIDKSEALTTKFGINTTQDNCQAVNGADIIILGVKPAAVQPLCEEISSCIKGQLIISITAGNLIDSIKSYLNTTNPVIRAMPNTPCLISKGMIGLYAGEGVSEEQQTFVSALFENIGEVVWLACEQQIDVVTALSGSGPAYFYYLVEALIKAGTDLGLDHNISNKLVTQTAFGATAMLTEPPTVTAQALRDAVTSPNGTTEAAIKIFDDQQLMETINKAIKAATHRAEEISKGG